MGLKNKLEQLSLSNECHVSIYITCDEKHYILELNYQKNRFVAEKQYPNTLFGVAEMEHEKLKYRNEDDVKEYFGII
jgi:hypothetical protein